MWASCCWKQVQKANRAERNEQAVNMSRVARGMAGSQMGSKEVVRAATLDG